MKAKSKTVPKKNAVVYARKSSAAKPTAVIYTRVAAETQNGEGSSLGLQEQVCAAYCNGAGIEVKKVFTESVLSGMKTDRPALKQLFTYCKRNQGKISQLIIHRTDRLSRNQEDLLKLKEQLAAIGIMVKSATESAETLLQEGILSAFHEYDRAVRSRRIVEGIQAKRVRDGLKK